MGRWLFRSFHRVHRAGVWVRERFTPAGRLVLGVLIASAVLGIDLEQSASYQLVAPAAAFLALALALGARFRGRFEVERELPRHATVGQPLVYRLRIRNLGTRAQRGLLLREVLDYAPPSYEEFVSARDPAEGERNWFDRSVGYPRWEWLLARRAGARIEELAVPHLPPGGEQVLRLELLPRRRGEVRFSGVCLYRPDPFGLFRARLRLPCRGHLLCLPALRRVSRPDLPARRVHQPGGVHLAACVGDDQEFFSLRDYRPGDPLRRIHWRSWARTGRPVVREHQEEFFVRHALVLDTCAAPEQAELLEEAVSIAAFLLLDSPPAVDGLLDLVLVGAADPGLTLGRHLDHAERALEVLACLEPAPAGDFRGLSARVIARAGGLSGCLCILLGWDAERQELVRRLRGLGVPVEVLVLTPKEIPLSPGPMADVPERLRAVPASSGAAAGGPQ